MRIRLLLLLFLLSAGSSAWASTPAEKPAMPEGPGVTVHRLTFETPSFDRIQIDNGPASDNVCLHIHAFIFKIDDDRVPKLVGETTCMPASGTAAKRVNREVQPKLMPATGGNLF